MADIIPFGDKRGRPTVFTPQVCAKLLEGVRLGMSLRKACGLAQINEQTLFNWQKACNDGVGYGTISYESLSVFFGQLANAKEERERTWLQRIEHAAEKGDWRADAWKLERTNRSDWGKGPDVVVNNQPSLTQILINGEEDENATAIGSLADALQILDNGTDSDSENTG